MRSLSKSPEYRLYRFLTADDTSAIRTRQHEGLNCENYINVHLQFIPFTTAPAVIPATLEELIELGLTVGGTTNPAVVMRVWSPAAEQFVLFNPTRTFAAAGAGVPWEGSVVADGRKLLAEVTGLGGSESLAILASGHQYGSVLA